MTSLEGHTEDRMEPKEPERGGGKVWLGAHSHTEPQSQGARLSVCTGWGTEGRKGRVSALIWAP